MSSMAFSTSVNASRRDGAEEGAGWMKRGGGEEGGGHGRLRLTQTNWHIRSVCQFSFPLSDSA